MAEAPTKIERAEDEAGSIAEVAYRLMQFVVGVERRSKAAEPRNRQDVLSLYAQCHRVARGEALPPRGKPAGGPRAAAPVEELEDMEEE